MFQVSLDNVIYLLVFIIVWAIRLEAKLLYVERDHNSHKDHVSKSDSVMWGKIEALSASLTSISLSLGRIEGRLGVKDES